MIQLLKALNWTDKVPRTCVDMENKTSQKHKHHCQDSQPVKSCATCLHAGDESCSPLLHFLYLLVGVFFQLSLDLLKLRLHLIPLTLQLLQIHLHETRPKSL